MNIFRFKTENFSINNERYFMIPLEILNHNYFMNRPSASLIAKLGGSMKYGGLMPYYGFLPAPFSTYKELIKEYNNSSISTIPSITNTNYSTDS